MTFSWRLVVCQYYKSHKLLLDWLGDRTVRGKMSPPLFVQFISGFRPGLFRDFCSCWCFSWGHMFCRHRGVGRKQCRHHFCSNWPLNSWIWYCSDSWLMDLRKREARRIRFFVGEPHGLNFFVLFRWFILCMSALRGLHAARWLVESRLAWLNYLQMRCWLIKDILSV